MFCCAVLCSAVLCCAVLCCAVLCCAVLCCAVLCCAMLVNWSVLCFAGKLVSAVADLARKGYEGAHSAAPHCAHHLGSHRLVHRYGHFQQPLLSLKVAACLNTMAYSYVKLFATFLCQKLCMSESLRIFTGMFCALYLRAHSASVVIILETPSSSLSPSKHTDS